jgi:hypothetical protein
LPNSSVNDQFWFSRILRGIEKRAALRDNLAGISTAEKAYPMGRLLVSEVIHYYFSVGSKQSIERLAAILVTFLSVGRAGECSFVTFKQASWNTIQDIFEVDWNEIKTGKQNPMCFYHDSKDFRLCFYFVMCCYFIVGAGSSHTTTMFASFL